MVEETTSLEGLSPLHRPLLIDGKRVPNRIVMPPLVTFLAREDGTATHENRSHYERSLGPGLIIVEATSVSPEGRITNTQLGLFHDSHIRGMAEIVKVIHESGALAAIQLHHGGAKAGWKRYQGLQRLAPTGSAEGGGRHGKSPCRTLSEGDIQRIVADFVAAARRAAGAGFDIVEIHAAHGYLANQFLSPLTNRRRDGWGGTPKKRRRFLITLAEQMGREVSGRCLMACRLGLADGKEGGLTVEEGLAAAKALEAAGISLIDISNGDTTPKNLAPPDSPFSTHLHMAKMTREEVGIPVIGVGGIKTPEQAETALEAGMADLIAVGKGILADPAWAAKTLSGRGEEISLCQDCNVCFHFINAAKCPARS